MSAPEKLRWLPGMLAIGSLYLVLPLLAIPAIWMQPHVRQTWLQLTFAVLLAAGGAGLLALRRWGWALCAAGAVVLLFLWGFNFYVSRQLGALSLALANLVIFFYLVRAEVRLRLR